MALSCKVALVLCGVILASALANALQFNIPATSSKCFSEEVRKDTLVVGDFNVMDSSSAGELEVTVLDPRAQYVDRKTTTKGKFAFTSKLNGEYRICFHNLGTAMHKIDFDFKTGVNARDYSAVAKKDNLKPVEVELKKLEDLVTSIHNDMVYLKEREEQMRNTNESTNNRVLWFSLFSMTVLVSLGVWQLYYLKRFFHAKKLI